MAYSSFTFLNIRTSPDTLLDSSDEFLRLEMLPQAERTLSELGDTMNPDDPRQVRRLERLGTVLRKEGKLDAARFAYTDAITAAIRVGLRDRYAADAYAGMGYCLQAQNNRALAEKFFLKALEAGAAAQTAREVEAELKKLRPAAPPSQP